MVTMGIGVQQDNATPGVYINQDGNSNALNIDAECTTTEAIYASADILTDGGVAYFVSNASGTQARDLVSVVNDNSAATGAFLFMSKTIRVAIPLFSTAP